MNYEITEEQIKELAKTKHGKRCTKKWFPEVFETKLEVGKWYVVDNIENGSLGFQGIGTYTEEKNTHGLLSTCKAYNFKEPNGSIWRTNGDIRKATDSEVEEALINEAKKRGFVNGNYTKGFNGEEEYFIEGDFYFENNELRVSVKGSFFKKRLIFETGKWADSFEIKTYTKEEAEKLLNAKII